MGIRWTKAVYISIVVGVALFAISGCDRLAIEKSLDGMEYQLVDQDSTDVKFPEMYSGQIMLVGYVYTHCPDICPLITYNMRDIQRAFPDQEEFMLLSISFDPERDSPEILYGYAENYRLDQSNWRFLTGDKNVVFSLLETLNISTVKTPTRFREDGSPVYYIDHSDRVTLIDGEGNVRRNYNGSEMNTDELIADIQKLLDEQKRGM